MSDSIGFDITYDVPFSREAVLGVCTALGEAIGDNWLAHRDQWSDLTPNWADQFPNWLEKAEPSHMNRVPDELLDETIEIFTDDLIIDFSPVSSWAGSFVATRNRQGHLGVTLQVPVAVQYSDSGRQRRCRSESPWPQNQACVRHIIAKLRAVYPIRDISVDGAFQ